MALGRPSPSQVRAALVSAGIGALILACLSSAVRDLLLGGHLLSAFILGVAALIVVPARYWLLAPFLAAGSYLAMFLASREKEQATGLPISWLDLYSAARNPEIIVRAAGYPGSLPALGLGLAAAAALLVLLAVKFARPRWSRLLLVAVEAIVLVAVAGCVLRLAGRDLHDSVAARFREAALEMWAPHGQALLVRKMGLLEYVAFTFAAGERDWADDGASPAPPLPAAKVAQAAARYLEPAAPELLPNIVILHAESTFDPNLVFALKKRVESPLWSRNPQTAALGPLRVNVVGGGTQVSQFELFTGADTRQFGYSGFYTHLTLAPRLKTAFPAELARKGYRTIASYPVNADWLRTGDAFPQYGFQKVYFADELRLKGDWSEADWDLVGRVLAKGALDPARVPTFLYLSTLENHGPHPCVHFQDRSQFATSLAGGASFVRDCTLNEYLRRTKSTERAMQIVLDRLKRLEKLTGRLFVLLVYGDHQPYSFTDGAYSVAGGIANTGDQESFARYRRGDTEQITFYHVITSIGGGIRRPFDQTIPTTLLPTVLSAYAARTPAEIYMPLNLLALQACGADYRGQCPMRRDIDAWTRDHLFGASAATAGAPQSRPNALR